MISSFFRSLSIRNVDLVWGTSPPIFQGFTAWLVARLKGKPFLLEIRDLWPAFAIAVGVLNNKLLIRLSLWLEKFLYKHADRLIVNSPGFVEHIESKGGRNIHLIPNGADPAFFKTQPIASVKRTYPSWRGKFVVLYTGAHGISNDLETVLKTADLLKENKNILFTFLGDGKEKPNLIRMAKDLDLHNLEFLDPLPKTGMPAIISQADACLAILKPIEMYKTTYPNKVFDYMAAGKPVILAIDGVIREVVEKADCGVFCPPGDAQKLKEAVLLLYNNREEASKQGANGKKYLKKHFNRSEIAEEFLDVVKEL